MQRCVELMGETEGDVARKKAASRRVKDLREAIAGALCGSKGRWVCARKIFGREKGSRLRGRSSVMLTLLWPPAPPGRPRRHATAAAQLEASDLDARQQHLKRQSANLKDRMRKLESQVGAGSRAGRPEACGGRGCRAARCGVLTGTHLRLPAARRPP